MNPDKTDWKIINALRNEHTSNNALARQMGVSEGMIRNRIQRLRDAGILTVRTLINPETLADSQLAVIAVNVAETRLLDEKAREISNLEGVLSVSIVSGRYDLIAEVLVNSNHGLVQFLTEQLSTVQGVSSTETFLLLKSYGKYV